MGALGRYVVAGVAVLLASACAQEPAKDEGPTERERVERYADDAPAVLLARVQDAYDEGVMRVSIERGTSETGPYTLVADPEAWRVESPTGEGVEGDGVSTVLAADDEICFDEEFRPVLEQSVTMSYGLVDFDPQPWSCTPADFGLNPLAVQTFGREDPRWRISHLTTDPTSASVEVEEVDGEPVLRLRTTGVTYDGPLDPSRPAYDLWIGSDLLPLRMETGGLTWEFDYPEDAAAALTLPASDERGSYGYLIGPGQGAAKMCYLGGPCPEMGDLTWGDGR